MSIHLASSMKDLRICIKYIHIIIYMNDIEDPSLRWIEVS